MTNARDHFKNSFVEVNPDSHFPIQNLPYGIFSTSDNPAKRVGVAIGDWVLDLTVLEDRGLLSTAQLKGQKVFGRSTLNHFMALGRAAWLETRQIIQSLLSVENPVIRDDSTLREQALRQMSDITMHLPAAIGDYTDFYSSKEHARNVGTMFRGRENAMLPNWRHLPVAYHGRASSIVVSGTPLHRPQGQILPDGGTQPIFGPSREVDFELEMGHFIGPGSELGIPVPIDKAVDHIFGLVLVNDWSARDIQRWEYRPLGPFLAKNFATTISPWVVTLEALEPFRCPGPTQEPEPLPYLRSAGNWSFDIQLDIFLRTQKMDKPMLISRSNYRHLYWNMCQQLTHHTTTGCNLRSGDLLATGTISGPDPISYGSMLELAWRGTKPIQLPNGEERYFLADGDLVTFNGYCQGDGFRVGFGEVSGLVRPILTY